MRISRWMAFVTMTCAAAGAGLAGEIAGPPSRVPAATAISDSALQIDSAIPFGGLRLSLALPVPPSKTGELSSLSITYDEAAPPWSILGALWRLDLPEIAELPGVRGTSLVMRRGSAIVELVLDSSGHLQERIGDGSNRYVSRIDPAGARSFERIDGNGVRWSFGRTDASRETRAGTTKRWLLDGIEDRSGNRIAFRYETLPAPAAKRIAEIEYDQHDRIGGGPVRLRFHYAARPAATDAYEAAERWRSSERLSRVSVETRNSPTTSSWTLRSQYELSYRAPQDLAAAGAYAPDGELEAIAVQAGGVRRTLYELEYRGGTLTESFEHAEISVNAALESRELLSSDVLSPAKRRLLMVGERDLGGSVRLVPDDEPALNDKGRLLTWTTPARSALCAIGSASLYCSQAPVKSPLPEPAEHRIAPFWTRPQYTKEEFRDSLRLGDLDGDARVDVCAMGEKGLECALDLMSSPNPVVWSALPDGPKDKLGWRSLSLVDVDLDTRDDICWLTGSAIRCALTGEGLGSGGTVEAAFPVEAKHLATFSFVTLNGDAYPDVCARIGSALECLLGTGDGFESGPTLSLANDPVGDERFDLSFVYLSLNLDGLTDLCFLKSKHEFQCRLGTGRGFDHLAGGPKWEDSLPPGTGSRRNLYAASIPKTLGSGSSTKANPAYLRWLELAASPTALDRDADGAQELCVRLNMEVYDCWRPEPTRHLHLDSVTRADGAREQFVWEIGREGNYSRLYRDNLVERRLIDADGGARARTVYAFANGYFDDEAREFRGYELVAETRFAGTPAQVHSVYRFYQGDSERRDAEIASLSGALQQVQTDEGGFRVLSLYFSDGTSLTEPYRRPRLRRVVKQWCDGGGCDPIVAVKPNKRPPLEVEPRPRPIIIPPWPEGPVRLPEEGPPEGHRGFLGSGMMDPERLLPLADRLGAPELLDSGALAALDVSRRSGASRATDAFPGIRPVDVPDWVNVEALKPETLCRKPAGADSCGFKIHVFTAEDDLRFALLGMGNAPSHWYALFRAAYSDLDYDRFGNVIEEKHRWLAETGSHSRRIRRSFAASDDAGPVNRLARERVYLDDASTPSSDVRYLYDQYRVVDDSTDCPDLDRDPGVKDVVSRGLPTRAVRWVDGPETAKTETVERWAYDSRGNVVCEWSAKDALTRFDYSGFRWMAERQVNPLSQVTSRRFYGVDSGSEDGPFGLPERIEYPSGASAHFTYDPFGRLTEAERIDRQGSVAGWEKFVYVEPTPTTPRRVAYETSDGVELWTETDALGEAVRMAWRASDGEWRSVLQRYDGAGRLTKVSEPARLATPGSDRRWSSAAYDNAGRPRSIRPYDGPATEVCRYQNVVATRRSDDRFTVVELSPLELPLAVHRVERRKEPPPPSPPGPVWSIPNGHPALNPAGPEDLPIPCFDGSAEPSDVRTTRYYRDGAARLVGIAEGGREVRLSYAPNGQIRSVEDPDVGTTTRLWGDDGLLRSATAEDGVTLDYSYDLLGRLVRAEARGASEPDWRTFAYDDGCPGCVGRLVSFATPDVTVSRRYDDFGYVSEETSELAGISRHAAYARTALGRLSSVEYPDGSRATYSFAHGNLSGVGYNGHPVLGAPSLDEHGHVTTLPIGDSLAARFTRNGESPTCPGRTPHLCQLEVAAPATDTLPERVLLQMRWQRNAADNVSSVVDVTQHGSVQLQFDKLDRLVSEAETNSTNSFEYALAGGLSVDDLEGTRTYDPTRPTRLLNTLHTELTYDARGRVSRLVTDAGVETSITYSAFGHPRAIVRQSDGAETQDYRLYFDALGSIRGFSGPDGRVRLDLGQQCVDATCRNVVELEGRPIGSALAGSTTAGIDQWVLSEPNGTVRLVVDAALTLEQRPRFSAFGVPLDASAVPGVIRPWMGQLDVAPGLRLVGARLYAPRLATFLQPDELLLDPLSPTPANRYVYAGQNPVTFGDDSGFRTTADPGPEDGLGRLKGAGRVFAGVGTVIGGIALATAVAGSVTVAGALGATAAAGVVVLGTLSITLGSVEVASGLSAGVLDTIADYGNAVSVSPAGKINAIPTVVGLLAEGVTSSESIDAETRQGVAIVVSHGNLQKATSDLLQDPTWTNRFAFVSSLIDQAVSLAEARAKAARDAERRSSAREHEGHAGDRFNYPEDRHRDAEPRSHPHSEPSHEPPERHEPPEHDLPEQGPVGTGGLH